MKKYGDIKISKPYGNKCSWTENEGTNYIITEGAYTGNMTVSFIIFNDKRGGSCTGTIECRIDDQVFTRHFERGFNRRSMMLYCSKFIDDINEYFYQESI